MPTPTCGQIVHFFPISELDKHLANNGADRVPAMIIQAFTPDHLNLVIFPMNVDCPVVLRYSVFHKSQIPTKGSADYYRMSYWDWPEIAPVVPMLPTDSTAYPRLNTMSTSDTVSGGPTFKQFLEDQRA